MRGPYEVGDNSAVYYEWTCPHCGWTCHKFKFELQQEEPRARGVRSLADYYADPSYRK